MFFKKFLAAPDPDVKKRELSTKLSTLLLVLVLLPAKGMLFVPVMSLSGEKAPSGKATADFEKPDPSLERYAVTRTSAMREGPGGRFVSMGLLSRGTRVIYANEKQKNWLKVRLRDGRKGWFDSGNLRELKPREALVRGGKTKRFYHPRPRPPTRTPFLFPLPGGRVNSFFGPRIDPISRRQDFHRGIDIAAPSGSPVRVVRAGVVKKAGRFRGYGKLVIVDHGLGLQTYYAHLRSIKVRKGQRVRGGQLIGRVGETGRTTGPHLHFEVRRDGRPVNPLLQERYTRGRPGSR